MNFKSSFNDFTIANGLFESKNTWILIKRGGNIKNNGKKL